MIDVPSAAVSPATLRNTSIVPAVFASSARPAPGPTPRSHGLFSNPPLTTRFVGAGGGGCVVVVLVDVVVVVS